jgi:hypothetical protein
MKIGLRIWTKLQNLFWPPLQINRAVASQTGSGTKGAWLRTPEGVRPLSAPPHPVRLWILPFNEYQKKSVRSPNVTVRQFTYIQWQGLEVAELYIHDVYKVWRSCTGISPLNRGIHTSVIIHNAAVMFRVMEGASDFTDVCYRNFIELLTVHMTQFGLYQVQRNRTHLKIIKQTTLY